MRKWYMLIAIAFITSEEEKKSLEGILASLKENGFKINYSVCEIPRRPRG